MNIFVHRASECLTDHESHGDGLICFSLLNGLAERGHRIYAYANSAPIRECSPNLSVKTARHRIPANSLAPWEHSWRAWRWMKELERTTELDLVWRMHPYGEGGPYSPQMFGKPLVVGPLFYGWPEHLGEKLTTGQPRLGVGLQSMVGPMAKRGWQETLRQSHTLFCATRAHTEAMQKQFPQVRVSELPVIIDPPLGVPTRTGRANVKGVTLLFVANLVPNKNPMLFCETIHRLRASGMDAAGIVLGDGPERMKLEEFCAANGLAQSVCFQGKVANSEVYGYLSEADFLASLSLGEPYGRGIAEAMSVGTPAVCHRSGGPADFIADGKDGLLVNELTAEAFAARILGALSDPGAWAALSANAKRTAEGWRSDIVLPRLEEALYAATQAGRRGGA